MKKLRLLFITFIAFILIGCEGQNPTAPTLAITPLATPVAQLPPTFTPPAPSERLFPTFPAVTVTQRPLPTQSTSTPIPFGDTTVEVRYVIPALGLDRRLQGSVSSQIILVDEATGQAVKRANQSGVLLDLQQILPDLLVPVVPEGCDTCVHITYNLPFANLHGDGWLRDPVLLASLENYTSVALGPHFPPGTIAGLRRSASPFAPAHTIAVTEDGLLYVWLANESQVGEPVEADPGLIQIITDLSVEGLAREYITNCMGSPLESLYVRGEIIGIVCPEYTLPTALLPLYARLDTLLAEKLVQSEVTVARPPTGFPLTAVLDYNRTDGARLTLYADGTAVVQSQRGEQVTAVISPTQTLSLTNELIATGAVRTGLKTFRPETTEVITTTGGITTTITTTPLPPRTLLLVRGPAGVYDGEWFNSFDAPQLAALNALLTQLLNPAISSEGSETPAAEAGTGTPAATETEAPAATGTATARAAPPFTPTPTP